MPLEHVLKDVVFRLSSTLTGSPGYAQCSMRRACGASIPRVWAAQTPWEGHGQVVRLHNERLIVSVELTGLLGLILGGVVGLLS